jgi:hypothetical protein
VDETRHASACVSKGRDFAAWLGLALRQFSIGDRAAFEAQVMTDAFRTRTDALK